MEIVHITRQSGIPLIGCIAFGIIDRGTDLIQVRPTSVCNLRCPYCSTNSNNPKVHPVAYEVELNYLIDYVNEVVKFKGVPVEANIDSVGEVACYNHLVELVKGIHKLQNIRRISMQTNGTMLRGIHELESAGLNQINLSLNALEPELAKALSGMPNYNLEKVLALAKIISDSSIELLIAPVWIPGINDAEMPKLIDLAKKLNAKIGIQKYETYRHSRKMKGAKPINYFKFYGQLRKWEKQFSTKLVWTASDFSLHSAPRLPTKFELGERVQLDIVAPGWFAGQKIGIGRGRCVTINDCGAKTGRKARVRIVENKNNIYVAEMSR